MLHRFRGKLIFIRNNEKKWSIAYLLICYEGNRFLYFPTKISLNSELWLLRYSPSQKLLSKISYNFRKHWMNKILIFTILQKDIKPIFNHVIWIGTHCNFWVVVSWSWMKNIKVNIFRFMTNWFDWRISWKKLKW